jgi:ferrous iron transport protein B
MGCHAVTAASEATSELVLVGHPNVGKSVLFQRLTGRYVVVSNVPGTTVDVFRGAARGGLGDVVDTPGIVGFPTGSDDERIVPRLLLAPGDRRLIQVGDAKSLRRVLLLTLQLRALDLPLVLALNMSDEADAAGIDVDVDLLAERLGIPVVATVATTGAGVDALLAAAAAAPPAGDGTRYPPSVEALLAHAPERGPALLWLLGDPEAAAALGKPPPPREAADAVRSTHAAIVDRLLAEAVREREAPRTTIAARLGRLCTHRVWGWPILAAVLFAMYWFVGILGAGRLVSLTENDLFGERINPWLVRVVPGGFVHDLLVGEYGIWTMALTYALALILPIVTTFFLAFSVLEDSGYLPRLAAVSNRGFTRLGLNGKAALPMVLGVGCVTMATLTTRILETRRERMLATLLLALGIPCSAQLGVVLGMLGSISPTATLIWSAVVVAVVVTVGAIAARLVPGERSPLLVELPPLRVPRAGNVLVKTLARLEWYLREVVPLFVAGTLFLFVLDKTGALPALIDGLRPLVTGWLGLPAAASTAFIVGFLRRDFGATGLFVLHANGQLTAEQAVVAMVTITLFIPCVASVLIIVRERGAAVAAAMTAFIFPLAFLVGGVVHRLLLLTGWGA